MDPVLLLLAVLLFGMGVISGLAVGAVSTYLYLVINGLREYRKRERIYDGIVTELAEKEGQADGLAMEGNPYFGTFEVGPNA